MMKNKIGIIGQGYVGTAIKNGFEDYFTVHTFDKFLDQKSTCSSLKSLVDNSDLIFICLPTPMNKDGSCHLNILEDVLSEINALKPLDKKTFVIKSTVPPGTTDYFIHNYSNLNIVYNPEFLREANFMDDFKKQKFIILGGKNDDLHTTAEIYSIVFPNIEIIKTSAKIAEMTKNMINTFLATKVSFANEMKIICDKLDVDYDKVVEYAIYDNRLGESHWAVPGPDGKLGFGGSCFPKDINALAHICKNLDICSNVILAAIDTNLSVRPEKDWEELKGRAVVNNDD